MPANSANPYTPPGAPLDPPPEASPPPRPARRPGAAGWLFISLALVAGAAVLVLSTGVPILGTVLLGLATLAAILGLVRGVQWFRHPSNDSASLGALGMLVAMLGNLVMAGLGALMTLLSVTGFSRGRQLRRRGRVLLPPLREGAAWAAETPPVEVPPAARAGLAAQWRKNGRTEHASVAAFARLTLDLMALGAPPALVASANRDALDEIRHAELCFSLARALDGASTGPGPFPEPQRARTLPGNRTLALAKLAIDSLVEGALHEGVSARIIARLARRCQEPATRVVLKELAADEGRHAAHGWEVVDWCLVEGGQPVARALAGALRVIPSGVKSALPAEAAAGQWERWGIHGHALEAEEYTAARSHLEGRLRRMIAAA